MYDAGARRYDPKLRRFYSVDPALQFASPYVYVGNNPITFVDPTGEFSGAALGIAIGVTVIGILISIISFGVAAPAAAAASAAADAAAITADLATTAEAISEIAANLAEGTTDAAEYADNAATAAETANPLKSTTRSAGSVVSLSTPQTQGSHNHRNNSAATRHINSRLQHKGAFGKVPALCGSHYHSGGHSQQYNPDAIHLIRLKSGGAARSFHPGQRLSEFATSVFSNPARDFTI